MDRQGREKRRRLWKKSGSPAEKAKGTAWHAAVAVIELLGMGQTGVTDVCT